MPGDLTVADAGDQMTTRTSTSAPQLCTVESLHPFKTHYVRNNRRSTEKNLRCFPCCNSEGHVTQGFCGRGCLFRVAVSPTPPELVSAGGFDAAKLSCVVELSLCETAPEGMPQAGQIYQKGEITNRIKGDVPEPWTRPYWKGVPTPVSSNAVDFSFTPTHWHYGWRSNKHTNTNRHTCRIYVFHEIDGGTRLYCLASKTEGAFTISSTKKRQPEVPPGTKARSGDKLKPKRKRRKKVKQKFDPDAVTPPMSPAVDPSSVPTLPADSHAGTGRDGVGISHAGVEEDTGDSLMSDYYKTSDAADFSSTAEGVEVDGSQSNRNSFNLVTEGMMMQIENDDGSDRQTNPFDRVVPVIVDNSSQNLDKFSFDSQILGDFSDVAQDAAEAASEQGATRANVRAKQQQQQNIFSEELSGGSIFSQENTTEAFFPGSTSPITREQIAAASKASLAKLQEDQDKAYNREKQVAALPPLHDGLLKTLSSQSMNSDKLMNDFIGEIDSFDGEILRQDQELSAMRQEEANLSQALNEALYMSPSRENSGTFLAFDKVDEERLRATSKSPSRNGVSSVSCESNPASSQNEGRGDDFTSASIRTATVIEEGTTESVVEAPQVVDEQAQAGSRISSLHEGELSETKTKIPQAPIVGVSMGVEILEQDNKESRGRSMGLPNSRWFSTSGRAPHVLGFAIGIIFMVSAIIVCIVLLLGSSSDSDSSNELDSSQPTAGRRLYLRAPI